MSGSLQPGAEVLVAEGAGNAALVGFRIPDGDGGQAESVEGIGLHHAVDGHVQKDEPVAGLQLLIKGVFAYDVARKAGLARKAAGELFFSGFSRADDVGAVGHFQNVGHVAGGGGIENGDGHVGLHHVEHRGDEYACVEGHGFTGFQIDLHVIGIPHMFDAAAQKLDVVIGAGDVVAAAEIDPFHAGKIRAEMFFHGFERAFQAVGILFAQGMEMQAAYAVQGVLVLFQFGMEGGRAYAEAGTGRTGIINGNGPFGVFRVEAEPAFYIHAAFTGSPLHHGAEFLPLGEGVEHDMVGIAQGFRKFLFAPCCGEGVHFPAEVFLCQPCLIGGTGAAAVKRAAHGAGKHGKRHPLGKALEREHDFCARALLYVVENGGVFSEQSKIGDEAGGGPGFGAESGKVFVHGGGG